MLEYAAQQISKRAPSKRLLLLQVLIVCIAVISTMPATAAELSIRAVAPGARGVEDLLRDGIVLYAAGDLAGADQVFASVREKVPAHPGPLIFEIKTLQARRSLDWWNPQYNDPIRTRADAAAALAREWIERDPGSARAHLYLGQALLELMVIKGISNSYYSAGVDGVNAGKTLERALELDPALVDAKVPLGTLRYYAAIAGKYVGMISWLWFVPKADRELGLAYLEEAARDADLFRFDAALTLSTVYMYVEEDPARALPLLEATLARNPTNSLLHFELVELRFKMADYQATIAATGALEQAVASQFGDHQRRKMARIWRARAELHLGRADRTKTLLAEAEGDWNDLTPWSRRWLLVTQANTLDLAGERASAVSLYERVVSEKARESRSDALAREGLLEPFRIESMLPPVATARSPEPARRTE
jgi:tetratricopeptide (TPR) repeat protein